MRRLAALVFLVPAAAIALQPAAPARADGDPCSDFLLVGSLCVPNNPRPSQPQIDRTQKTIDAAKQGGYEIRVAVIGTPTDLGSVPVFFGRPAPYAKFLDAELQSAWKGKLLVVMAAGYGLRDDTKPYPAGVKALGGLPPPANGTPDALMAAATVAVRKLAASEGVKVPVIPLATTVTPPATTGSRSSSGSTSFVKYALLLAAGLVVLGVIVAAILFWPDGEDEPEPD
ncbi:MAG TPA: hypothetical protein VM684_01900 [Gaiellales bacterium]|jgi:hypothetical protein|nr:hypothetical protein [Gaiellales bacterium]